MSKDNILKLIRRMEILIEEAEELIPDTKEKGFLEKAGLFLAGNDEKLSENKNKQSYAINRIKAIYSELGGIRIGLEEMFKVYSISIKNNELADNLSEAAEKGSIYDVINASRQIIGFLRSKTHFI